MTNPQEVDPMTERRKLTFDPTINAGHLLTFAGFIIAIFVGWTTLDKRVVVLEEERKRQAQVDSHQDNIQQAQMTAVRESLSEIKQGIKELAQRMESRR